ncbi:MAG TPA: hypothetical protein PLY87_20375 [Planctomycetaceae bacterium]|nr:hypothetical protein [Planctomycetaceae bacterium]HQZ67462.1 hypothetical protein [Planctomycetaceae bacterium]
MNAAFTRLLWKEYRAQRALWLLLLLAAFAMYAMMRSFGAPWTVTLALISFFSICFLVAEFAIAFAGEVDEGTVGLLRMLPCRTRTLFSAKLAAVFGGCLLLAVASLTLCGLFELMAQFFPRLYVRPEVFVEEAIEDTLIFGLSVGLFCAASLFASLISRKIISSVGLAAALIAAIFIGVSAFAASRNRIESSVAVVWFGSISIGLFFVSLFVLARRWHLGRLPWTWSVPGVFRESADRRLPSFAALLNPWLHAIALRPMSQRRVFATLFWRECRSAVPFACMWFVIGLVVCSGRLFFVEYPWPLLFLLVFIHECGQLTMREDQRSRTISFLANVGISPRQIYWSKMSCWLSVAIAGTACIVAVDFLIPSIAPDPQSVAREFRILSIMELLRIPDVQRFSNVLPPATVADRWLQAGTYLSIVLGLFSIGQVTASWIQRQVLAFAASFVLAMSAAGPLVPYVIDNDWSVWIALVPVPFCFLFATLTTARNWIDRTITWRLRVRQAAWIIVPMVCCPLLAGYFWFNQPAAALAALDREMMAAPWYHRRDKEDSSTVAATEELTRLEKLPPAMWNQIEDSAGAKCWYEFAAVYDDRTQHGLLIQNSELQYSGHQPPLLLSQCQQPEVTPEVIRELLRPFDEILTKTDAFPMLPATWTAPWSETPSAAITAALLEDARLLEAAADIDGAVRQITLAIRLNRALAIQTSSWGNWLKCLDAERVALGRLRLLLGTADLASVDLEALFQELKAELVYRMQSEEMIPQWHDVRPMLRRRTLFYSAAAASPLEFFTAFQSLPTAARGFRAADSTRDVEVLFTRDLGSIDAARFIEVMKFSEALLVAKYHAMVITGRVQYRGPDLTESIRQLKRFLAASSSSIPELQTDVNALDAIYVPYDLYFLDTDTVVSERATLLTIKLHQYRLEHGAFPETLLALMNGGGTDYLIYEEPWSGSPFLYTKQATKTNFQINNQAKSTVATGCAILATPDAWLSNFRSPVFSLTPEGIADIYELPANLVLFIGTHDPVDWRLIQFTTLANSSDNNSPVSDKGGILPPRQ